MKIALYRRSVPMSCDQIADPNKPITAEVIGVGRKEFPNAYVSYEEMVAAVVACSRPDGGGVHISSRGFASFDDWNPETRVLRLKFHPERA